MARRAVAHLIAELKGAMLAKMKTRISSQGRVVIPAEFRDQDRIKAGQTFEIERLGPGAYRLVRSPPLRNQGLVAWLRTCPGKGFFVALESESTDE